MARVFFVASGVEELEFVSDYSLSLTEPGALNFEDALVPQPLRGIRLTAVPKEVYGLPPKLLAMYTCFPRSFWDGVKLLYVPFSPSLGRDGAHEFWSGWWWVSFPTDSTPVLVTTHDPLRWIDEEDRKLLDLFPQGSVLRQSIAALRYAVLDEGLTFDLSFFSPEDRHYRFDDAGH